jgi:hypothetical protein
LAGLLSLLQLCLAPVWAAPATGVERVDEGVYLFRSGAERSLFMVTDAGVIVTDPLNPAAATRYRAAIRSITDQPVKYVVYSHYHWDRAAGGRIFADEGALFVAQGFRVNPNPAVVMPDITFADHYSIELGEQTLRLHYFGPAHGDCLTIFEIDPAGLVQIVDMVNPPRASFPENPLVSYIKPHNLRQFFAAVSQLVDQQGIERIVASRVRTVTGSDGVVRPSPPTGPVSIIQDQARFWDAIRAAVEKAEEAGSVGNDSMVPVSAVDLEVFRAFDGYDAAALPIIMRRFVGFYDMGR